MMRRRVPLIVVILIVLLGVSVSTGLAASVRLHEDVFRLSTGEIIIGELLSFDGRVFEIRTERGVIRKEKEEIVAVLVGVSPWIYGRSISQWASRARASSQYSSSDWSAQQATGEPDTQECGDVGTAWAPRSSTSRPEWLEVTFDTPVYAETLRIHETYNSGFIYRVELVDVYGQKHTGWQGRDTTPCPGWFEINIDQTRYLVKSVILHTRVEGYEEIDAVELTGLPISR